MTLINTLTETSENVSSNNMWSFCVAVASMIIALIALLFTFIDFLRKKRVDFRDTILSHMGGLLDLYNDSVLIVEPNHLVQDDKIFCEIEKKLLTDFNFLFSYGKLKRKKQLVIFSTFTPKTPTESFANVLFHVEEKYKKIRTSYNNKPNDKDLNKMIKFVYIFSSMLDIIYKYLYSVLYFGCSKKVQSLNEELLNIYNTKF